MKYWPLSRVLGSPHMPQMYVAEAQRILTHPPSMQAYNACVLTALSLPHVETNMVIIESQDGPTRTAYADAPAIGWEALERAGVVQDVHGHAYMVMEQLH